MRLLTQTFGHPVTKLRYLHRPEVWKIQSDLASSWSSSRALKYFQQKLAGERHSSQSPVRSFVRSFVVVAGWKVKVYSWHIRFDSKQTINEKRLIVHIRSFSFSLNINIKWVTQTAAVFLSPSVWRWMECIIYCQCPDVLSLTLTHSLDIPLALITMLPMSSASLSHTQDRQCYQCTLSNTHTHSLSDKNDNTIDVKSQIRVGKETAENVLSLSFIEIRENVVLRASFSKPLKAATTRRPLNQINIFKFTLKTLF